MTQFEKEIFKINFIEENNLLKEKFIQKLDHLFKDASSLTDVNKNIYECQNNLTLSWKNNVESNLKESIKFNELLSKEKGNINIINKNIINEYKKISGISISRTDRMNLKINFDFLGEKDEYYIILSFYNSTFEVVEINPKDINFKKYNVENYEVKNIGLFLCKLINYELIPYFKNNLKK